jgi:hypothetical protein
MQQDTGKPVAHSLNTQLFSVCGQGYVPHRTSDFSFEIEQLKAVPKTNVNRKRWLVFYAVAAVVVIIANLVNIGTIVHATTRPVVKPAPVQQQSLGGATSIGVVGGLEAVRW